MFWILLLSVFLIIRVETRDICDTVAVRNQMDWLNPRGFSQLRAQSDPNFHVTKAKAYAGLRSGIRDDQSDEALKIWIIKAFYDMFRNYSIAKSADELANGKQIYDNLKAQGADFQIAFNSDVRHETDVPCIRKVVDDWRRWNMINDQGQTELKAAVDSPDFIKVSRGNAFTNGNNHMQFFVFAYATTDIFTQKTGAFAAIFIYVDSYGLDAAINTQSTTDCFLWNIFCKTQYQINAQGQQLTGDQSSNLAAYLFQLGMNQFNDFSRNFFRYEIDNKAEQYKSLLPDEVRQKVQNIENNKNVRPDQLYSEDPLNGNKLPWSKKQGRF